MKKEAYKSLKNLRFFMRKKCYSFFPASICCHESFENLRFSMFAKFCFATAKTICFCMQRNRVSHAPLRTAFKIKQHEERSWNYIFNNPQPITLKSFVTGYVIISKIGTINPDHPKAGAIEDELLEVPVLAHWIHHENLGDYLIDTGLDISFHDNPHGNMKGLLAKLFIKAKIFVDEYKQAKNQNICHHIKEHKIKLNGVFFTHLHPDHMAGTRELPKNIPYIVGKGEKYHEHYPFFYGNYLKGVKKLYEIDFKDVSDMPPLGKCVDIFGDGSLWAISTPGHTKGHISFLINSKKGPILIAGDVCFIKSNFEKGAGPSSYTENVKINQESLDRIIKFKSIYPQIRVICGHETL